MRAHNRMASALLVVACSALLLGSPTAGLCATEYHALLIGNDELTADNDMIENALLNWNDWKNNGTITKKDDQTGAQIIAEITAWTAGIDSDDVAVFYYGGHGGLRADGGADEGPPPAGRADPIKDNDTTKDNVGRQHLVDGIVGKNGALVGSHRTDD